MSDVREVWKPKRMTASGMLQERGRSIGGFFCTTGGTVQITVGETSGGADIVSQFTAVAATYYPLPFYCQDGAYVVLGGGAAGTFAV
jgi:hypothetical protein